jgi:hypothetical protein
MPEDLRRQQEGAAIDRGGIELLAEPGRPAAFDEDAGPLAPRLGCRSFVHEDGGAGAREERLQGARAEDVVHRDEGETVLVRDIWLTHREGGPVAALPSIGADGADAPRRDRVHDRGDRLGMMAHDHEDLLDPAGEEPAHGPLDQREPSQPDQGLGSVPGQPGQALRPAGGQHHAHAGPGRGHAEQPGRHDVSGCCIGH